MLITKVSPQEYLEREAQAEVKSEYHAGDILAMAGASFAHVTLTANITGELYVQLKGRSCQVTANDLRVRTQDRQLYAYPDVTIVCGAPQFETEGLDTLINPTVLMEVLSDSTEAWDRGDKFRLYARLESLQEYVLISQKRICVEHFVRQTAGQWLLTVLTEREQVLNLTSVDCALRLSDIYDRLHFE